MTDIVAGSRMRFLARFRLLGKLYDPGEVEVRITSPDGSVVAGEAKRSDVGIYFIDEVVRQGDTIVRFQAATGEFVEVTCHAVRAELSEEQMPVVVTTPQPQRVDRADARRQILAAGIPYEDSWSDAKIRGVLDGLAQNERSRRVHRS